MSDSLWLHGLYSLWNSPGQNTGEGIHSLLQGIFPTWGSNSDLLHCRQILYQLSHQGGLRRQESPPFSDNLPLQWCQTYNRHPQNTQRLTIWMIGVQIYKFYFLWCSEWFWKNHITFRTLVFLITSRKHIRWHIAVCKHTVRVRYWLYTWLISTQRIPVVFDSKFFHCTGKIKSKKKCMCDVSAGMWVAVWIRIQIFWPPVQCFSCHIFISSKLTQLTQDDFIIRSAVWRSR